MAQKEIGTVVSTMEGPSPTNVDFVVSADTVHKGQFVELEYSEGKMVCMITDAIKTNRYFERAESVKEFEKNGKKLFEQFPVGEWEYLLAKTRPLGVQAKDGSIKRPTFPPSPGTRVMVAENESLKRFLSLDDTGLNIGKIEHHDLEMKIKMHRLLQKHVAILALSGAGKSFLTSVILEELLDRPKESGRIAVVLFDVHGEYTGFAEHADDDREDYSARTKLVRSKDIRIGVPKMSVFDFTALLPNLSPPQKRDLGKALSKLREEMKSGMGPFGLPQVMQETYSENEGKKSRTADSLGAWLMEMNEMNLFDETDSFSIRDIAKPGQLAIIDLSTETSMKKKQAIVAHFLRKLFNERKNKKIPPFLAVLEESHQFAPEGTKSEHAIAKGTIETIAREGRKFGASICLISQRPKRLSTTTLSQCNTNIILRITNPYDLKHISESSEGIDAQSEKMISSLRVGEALLLGEAVNYPVFIKVRQRKSMESRHEKNMDEAAREFEEQEGKREGETEEYL